MTVDLLDLSSPGSLGAAPAAAPDPGVIALMANALFSAVPGTEAAAFGLPGGFRPEPPAAVPVGAAIPNLAPAPAIPAAPPAAAPVGPPVSPTSFAHPGLPGGLDYAAVPQSLGGALSLIPQGLSLSPPREAAPELPGGSFYFLDGLLKAPGAGTVPAAPRDAASPLPGPGVDLGLLPVEHRPEAIPTLGVAPFDPRALRRDFPILEEKVHGRPLIWLDNAATTQKPRAVIERLAEFYERENSNIHRAAHALAARSTDAYEAAREKVRRFLGAASTEEIIFVRGATEGINLIAQSWGRRNIGAGDEIVISWLEHHANIVPWQQLAAEKGARIKVAPVDDSGQIILEEYEKLFTPRTRIASFTQVSNALGTVAPVREMVEIAHRHGARVLVDGAQSVSHLRTNVQALDADFYVFSGHKVFGPTGIGAVYGKKDVLETMPPWQGGGNMIADVTFEKTIYQPAPARFEAGTGNIADAVGLGAALDYVERVGLENIARYEHELLVYATRGLQTVPGLTLIGTAKEKAGVLSFTLDGYRTEEVGQALDREGIAVRSGHHCAQPILRRFGLESTVRPSLAFYNICEDIDALVAALLRLKGSGG
ncbi:MAG: family 2A encapsulin nanocompartment cargo protein cysteine desulfurase [Rhodospirillaceae bacterium]